LLDRELTDEYRREWTVQVAEERHVVQRQLQSVFVFRIGGEWLALPVPMLQAVVPQRAVHAVPHHRDGLLLGLVTLRGQLVLCISLAKLLGVASDPKHGAGKDVQHQTRFLIIGEREDQRVVVPVDEVYGIVRYGADAVRELPSALASGARYTTNVLLWAGHTVACLDGTLLLYAVERALA
jgi:chemotaxis-related protein WspD